MLQLCGMTGDAVFLDLKKW